MRLARNWFFSEFNPETMAEYKAALLDTQSAYLRMVVSYWEMAAALVNYGSIDSDLFSDTNGEHIAVFAKLEPLLVEIRVLFGPQFMASLERMIDDTKNGRERVATTRARMKEMRTEIAAAKNRATTA